LEPDQASFEPETSASALTEPGCSAGDGVEGSGMFVFFSDRLGCAGSILVSLVVTGILILLFMLL